jgi:Fuc2NAc and GlcNAc transferase
MGIGQASGTSISCGGNFGDHVDASLFIAGLTAAILAALLCRAAMAGMLPFLPVAGVTDRGLHETPVRTSAGVAIVAGLLAGWAFHIMRGGDASLWPVMSGMVALSLLGLADDRMGLSARLRFAVQIIVVGVWMTFGASFGVPAHLLLLAPALLAILWFVNLFNFMDGSDGLAASQTIVAIVPWLAAAITGAVASTSEIDSTLAALAGGSLGFLVFNWPRARLFMGDAGSLSIPFLVTGLALSSPERQSAILLCLIGFAPFITDASVTLLIRILSGERWWSAHRSHAYQLAARKTGRHLTPLVAIWVYGLLWLLPVSLLAANGSVRPIAALVLAYVPVAFACAVTQWKLRRTLPA